MSGFRSVALALAVSGCTHAGRPTITGAALYGQLVPLSRFGRATVQGSDAHPVVVHYGQLLVADVGTYALDELVKNCPEQQFDDTGVCLLESQLDTRFRVYDTPKDATSTAHRNDRGLSWRGKATITGLVLAAPLALGVATCDFAGCQALFGVPLALDALFVIVLYTGLH